MSGFFPYGLVEWKSPLGSTLRFDGVSYERAFAIIEEHVREHERRKMGG